jgi:hypothetical protein
VRISDGRLLEQVKLGTMPGELVASPDGNTLVAVSYLPGTITGEFAVMIIDLR